MTRAVWPGTARPESHVMVGLMSGTSLDGISAAVCRFHEMAEGGATPELLSFIEHPYDAPMRQRLSAALTGVNPAEYTRLDFDLGAALASAAIAAIAEAGVPFSDIAAVASHGHTVWHDPPHGTWQFGQAAVIAERVGLPVVSDFRVRDVAAGGQGAPLVPIADAMLFASPTRWRALQNIGGIGNVTVVPPSGSAVQLSGVRAFDTGPGVCVIDGVTRQVRPDLPFDRDGALAASGHPIDSVVDASLAAPFFSAPPPKSTGRELFSARYIDDFIARCRVARRGCTDADIVATAVELTARSIAQAYERFVPEPVGEVVLTGGGARNPALAAAVKRAVPPHLATAFVHLPQSVADAREAIAFAFLGWLHLRGRPGNVRSATGARAPCVLGTYTPA